VLAIDAAGAYRRLQQTQSLLVGIRDAEGRDDSVEAWANRNAVSYEMPDWHTLSLAA
jgi:hypothetical protein